MAVLSAVVSVVAVLLLIYVPGAAAAALLVRRPLLVLAVAPAVSYAMYSAGAMATTAVGVRWSRRWSPGGWSSVSSWSPWAR